MRERLRGLVEKVRAILPRAPAGAASAPGVDQNAAYDRETLAVMTRVVREDSSCVDVGCHQGAILKEMLRLAPRGTHFAFEPLPHMYEALVRTFGSLANVHLHRCALSDAAGRVSFQHVVTNPGYSGFRRRRYDRPDEQISEITVEARRLDAVLPADAAIRLVKVDVEGAELQVFRGAVETIRRCRPVIVFEHGVGAADHYGTTPESVYDLLSGECGLRLFLMRDWLATDGRSSLDREAFARKFSQGEYYFMAAP